MPYSRTRSRRQARLRKRRLIYVNAAMLAAIVVIGGLLANRWLQDGGSRMIAALFAHSPPGLANASPEAESPPAAPPSAGGAAEADGGGPSASASSPAAAGSSAAAAGGADDSVTLAFVGDILPASRVGDLIDKYGVDYPFARAADSLKSADLTAGNLEAPLTNRGTPAENKAYVFKGKPQYATGLADAGFDVLTLANNHTLDQGWEGLQDTMDALDEAGIAHIGSGADDAEAFTPAYLEANGVRVAYIGVSNVVPEVSWKADKRHPGVAETYDTTRAVAAVRNAKELADIVVVMVHWGKERAREPIDVQTRVGHTLIDAGADLVIGSHPHVLQGFEYYKNRWIAYSLGNFVFTTAGDSITQQTGVLKARCAKDGQCELTLEPMLQTDSQPAPMDAADGAQLLADLSALSIGASVGEDGSIAPSAPDPDGEEKP